MGLQTRRSSKKCDLKVHVSHVSVLVREFFNLFPLGGEVTECLREKYVGQPIQRSVVLVVCRGAVHSCGFAEGFPSRIVPVHIIELRFWVSFRWSLIPLGAYPEVDAVTDICQNR